MDNIDLEIKNINAQIENRMSIHDNIARWVSQKAGSMSFIYILLIIVIFWTGINLYMFTHGMVPFDKPYEFQVFLSISSLIQLFIPLFILVSQNIQESRTRALADQQYKIAKRTEMEAIEIFDHLRNLGYNMNQILEQLKLNQNKIIEIENGQNSTTKALLREMIDSVNRFAKEMAKRPCLMDREGL